MPHEDPDRRRAYQAAYQRQRRAKEKIAGLVPTNKIEPSSSSKKMSKSVTEFNKVEIGDLTREKFDAFLCALAWDMARGKLTKIEADQRRAGIELMRAVTHVLPSEKVQETKTGRVHAKYMADSQYRELARAMAKRQQEIDEQHGG